MRTETSPPAPPASWLYLGLDLGQAQDYSALAIVARDRPPQEVGTSWQYDRRGVPTPVTPALAPPAGYAVSWLQRFPLRTAYPAIVAEVAALVGRLAERAPRPRLALVVDATGVGRPVVDLLRREQLPARLVEATITGGDTATREGSAWRVPKRELVSTVQVLLQGERLKIADALPDAATLTRELLAFQVKINPETAHDSYGAWREGAHDDLVLATALACWYGETERQPPPPPPAVAIRRRY